MHTRRSIGISALALAVSLLLAACGGGGVGDISGSGGIIGGTGLKGPVGGATVTAYAISGGTVGNPIGMATTDGSGSFSMPIGSYAGAVMLQLAGGTYIDEASGVTMPMALGDVMTAMLPPVTAGAVISNVHITPLTSMAQTLAQGMTGRMSDANIAAANAAVGTYFMVGDILRVNPINPRVVNSGKGAAQDSINYGMAMAAMSQYAKGLGMASSSAIVTAMMNDAADGMMDGMRGGSPVSMSMGGMMGNRNMAGNAGTSGLAAAMGEFLNSPANVSGLSTAEMTALMTKLANSNGRM